MSTQPSDRRREPRDAASGPVKFTVTDPVTVSFTGQLLDLSNSGFRAKHDHQGLHAGLEIEYQHLSGEGVARVMWTRIIAGDIESGFLLI